MATASATVKMLTSTVLLLFLIQPALSSWDNIDEIYDLMEEVGVNENFYTIIGVEQTATTGEIRKAFRKISVRFHPDKTDEPDAEERFRKLAAIYEILKDEKKRETYNQVLIDGLPTWRNPAYYYRKARKMSMIELIIVLSLIATIGQYCVNWGVYIEQRLVLEEVLSSKKKKKGKKSKSTSDGDDEEIKLPTPRLLDVWIIQFPKFIFLTVYNLPMNIREWKEEKKRQKEEEERERLYEEEMRQLEEEEKARRKELAKTKKAKKKPELPEYSQELYSKFSNPTLDGNKEYEGSLAEELEKASQVQDRFGEEWTDEDLVLLAKAVKKYPGGTTDRWEKIADMLGRSVVEVTNKAKEGKIGSFSTKVSPSVQGTLGSSINNKSEMKISDAIITQNLDAQCENLDDDDYYSSGKVRKRKKDKKRDNPEKIVLVSQANESMKIVEPLKNNHNQNEEHSSDVSTSNNSSSVEVKTSSTEAWTQNQQKILEWALKQYPKGTDRRWDCVAEHIPGKTKEECIARFKELAELISQKKKSEFTSKTS